MLWRYISTGDWSYAALANGTSFHFSALVIYGLLYVGISIHLRREGIRKTRNVLYSIAFVALNVALFELLYLSLFNHFQLHRNLLLWLRSDFAFLCNYFLPLLFGVYAGLLIYTERLHYHWSRWVWISLTATCLTFIVWIFYPFPTTRLSFGAWTNNLLFPQTHYAYVSHSLYAPNDVLHTVNLVAKSLIALTQYMFVRGLQRST